MHIVSESTGRYSFTHAGITYDIEPCAHGLAGGGLATIEGALRMIRHRRLARLSVLDLCCGCGVIGLSLLQELGGDVIAALTLADINIFSLNAAQRAIAKNGITHPILRVVLSDGLAHVDGCFDLIVSNPPHVFTANHIAELTPSMLATYDAGWQFHREFYGRCHGHLAEHGEVWFLENAGTEVESAVAPIIAAQAGRLEYVGRCDEPSEAGYFWMLTRRVA